MTDRYFSLTVVLKKDLRTDDAQPTIEAILQLKGVLEVTGNVTDIHQLTAEIRARDELADKLWAVLYPAGRI